MTLEVVIVNIEGQKVMYAYWLPGRAVLTRCPRLLRRDERFVFTIIAVYRTGVR